MKTLRQIELELIEDWQRMQLIESAVLKEIALKAYHIKYTLYRKAKAWEQMLLEPIITPL